MPSPKDTAREDFLDRARVLYESVEDEFRQFLDAAVEFFRRAPWARSFTAGEIDANLLALRWGCADESVLILRIEEFESPRIYGDVLPERATREFLAIRDGRVLGRTTEKEDVEPDRVRETFGDGVFVYEVFGVSGAWKRVVDLPKDLVDALRDLSPVADRATLVPSGFSLVERFREGSRVEDSFAFEVSDAVSQPTPAVDLVAEQRQEIEALRARLRASQKEAQELWAAMEAARQTVFETCTSCGLYREEGLVCWNCGEDES